MKIMKLLKQRNIPMLGAVIDSFVSSMPLMSVINFASIGVILYMTSIQPFAEKHMPWLTLPVFIFIMMAGVFVLMVIVYKFVLPSVWTFRGKQMFGYDNLVSSELKNIAKRLEKIEEQNGKIK